MKHLLRIDNRRLAAAALAVVAVGALYLVAPPAAHAAKAAASPLDFVPSDAAVFVTVQVGDLWAHPAVKAWRAKAGKELPEPLDIRKHFGVAPDEIDRITLFSLKGGPPLIALTTIKPYDRKAVLLAVAPDAKPGKPDEGTERKLNDRLFISENGGALYFRDDRTVLFGGMGNLSAAYMKTPAAWPAEKEPEGPLTPLLRLASEKHLVLIGADMAALPRTIGLAEKLPPDAKPVEPLLKARLATLAVDLGDSLRGKLKLTFATAGDASQGTAALDAGMGMFRDQFAEGAARFSRQVKSPKLKALLDDVQTALKAAKAEQKGTTVETEAALKIDPDAITATLTESLPLIENAAKRIQLANDLKQLSLASMSYADANGGRMPTDLYDKNGKLLLSWRVAVLPYIEGGNLYSQFHLDEPWDSEHNKKLLEKMPETFAPKDTEAYKNHETFFQAFVGKGTVFEKSGLRFPADIPDGTSNTILFVEAKKAVPWTKPDDIPFDKGKLLPKVGGLTKGGFMAAMCDGSVHFIPLTVKEETLRIWIIRNSGQLRPALDK
jgi:hypothetical protein